MTISDELNPNMPMLVFLHLGNGEKIQLPGLATDATAARTIAEQWLNRAKAGESAEVYPGLVINCEAIYAVSYRNPTLKETQSGLAGGS